MRSPPEPGEHRAGPTRLVTALVALALLAALLFDVRLHQRDAVDGPAMTDSVLPQLRFLRRSLDAGDPARMQQLFPEGQLFELVLYGLAWVDVGLAQPEGSPLRAEALGEARRALAELDTPDALAPFSPSLSPPRGVFQAGWSSWLRGAVVRLGGAAALPEERHRLDEDCRRIAAAFDARTTPFLESYPGQAWPCDSVVAMAALRQCDTLAAAPRHQATIARFLRRADELVDADTGLLPHRVDPRDGRSLGGARGSSQATIQRFLPALDAVRARASYLRFRELFLDTRLGLPAILEYPRGTHGEGDVDSGPLILGVSASSTVVALGAARLHGDTTTADALTGVMEAMGLPLTLGGQKRYALGLLPVGDAFIAWAKAATPLPDPSAPPLGQPPPPDVVWRWFRAPGHAVVLVLLALLLRRLRRHRASRQP